METKSGKESVVARLFGFGRKRSKLEEPSPEIEEEHGFARTDDPDDDAPQVTIPEQVIRVRPGKRGKQDEVIGAIGESFKELTRLLGSVSERLDRQDHRSVDLSDQLKDLPEYLRALPRLQEQQNDAVQELAKRVGEGTDAIKRLPDVQESQNRSLQALNERIAEGTDAVHGVAETLARIPEELRARSESQDEALRQVAAAQQQTAKVIYAGHQKSIQLFHQATQKTLQSVNRQRRQLENVVDESVANMKRMFVLAAAFMVAAITAVAGLIFFG